MKTWDWYDEVISDDILRKFECANYCHSCSKTFFGKPDCVELHFDSKDCTKLKIIFR